MPSAPAERGSTWSTLALVCVAQFIDVLGVTAVVVALPSIGPDLRGGAEALQWVVSVYALCFGGFLLLAGRAADLFGPRRMFVGGLVVFASASAACGLAPSLVVMLGARAVQGTAAAAMVPSALSLLTATFRGGPKATWALGIWTAAAAGGGATGFLVGGLLSASVGWRSVFLLFVPICLLTAALAHQLLAESRGAGVPGLDVAGALLVTLGLGSAIAGLAMAAEHGLASSAAIIAMLAGIALLGAFVFVEARHENAIVPLPVLRRPRIAGSAAVAFTLTATTSGAAILVTSYLQKVRFKTPAITGLVFLPFSALVIAGSLAGPQILRRAGGRATLVLGMLCVAAGLLTYTTAGEEAGIPAVACGLAISGAGLGSASVAATSIGIGSAGRSEQGLVAGILNAATQLGTAAGVAVLGALANAHTEAAVPRGRVARIPVDGFHRGWFAAAAIATGAATLVALRSEWPPSRARSEGSKPAATRGSPERA
jgi:MFS family permease